SWICTATGPSRTTANPGWRCSGTPPATATMKSAMRNTSVAQSARPNCVVSGVNQHSRPATVYHYNERSTVKANARHNVLLTLTAILSESVQGAKLGQSNVFMAFEVDHNRHTDANVFIRDPDD